jgi:signal transduction histidine kinase
MQPDRRDDLLWQRYRDVDRDLRVRNTKIVCILTIVLVAAGSSLDHFQYPGLFWSIFPARVLCNIALLLVFGVLYTGFGRRHVRWCGTAWALAPSVTISWMIYIAEGSASPFYAGLNLVIIAFCLFIPCTMGEALLQCALVIATYLVACLLHTATPLNVNLLCNNLIFMTMTSVLGIAACHVSHLRRISDFQLRYELDRQNKQLMELDRLKSQFFANVSHELRTPLTLILAPVGEILQDPAIPASVLDALALVKKNGDRLLRLINDLLEIVRLEEGRLKLEQRLLHLEEFVPGIADSVRELARQGGLSVEVSGFAEPLVVCGDESRLEKVLLNLLTNAIKFTPPGGKILVRGWREDETAKIEVADTGIGISPEELPHIFERFRQVDSARNPQSKGLGLGLALSRDLIEEHGGCLTVSSEPERGTSFVISLPAAAADAEPAAGDAPPSPEAADPFAAMFREASRSVTAVDPVADDLAEVGGGAARVLIVDDEPDMRRFLVHALSGEHTILQAADGEAGLRLASQERPDLLVLDLMLPGMNGLEVCRRLRKDEAARDTKILMLTARIDEASKIEALECGADDFLTKPFSTIEVKTRINNLLEAGRLQRDLRDRNEELQETLSKLRATESQLVQSEKMNALGSLAAGLLHEVNNPLNYTMMALELARQAATKPGGDVREALNDIEEGMNRIGEIVSDLRAFAYPGRAAQHEPFDLREALDTALRFTAYELSGLGVDLSGFEDGRVEGARTQITQVFVNMITNAVRATEPIAKDRPASIRVSSQANGQRLYVRVWDNGVGIAPHVMPRVLDPFFTTREVGQGVGLGLSICHTIVRNHGGTIAVDSKPGDWTEFTFHLPLSRE